jgi:hypothetical protein
MIDQMIICPLCKNKEKLVPMKGTDSFPYRNRPSPGTLFIIDSYRESFESQCSLCQGTGWVDKKAYDSLLKEIKEVKPERPNTIIDKPVRIIDLDDTKK